MNEPVRGSNAAETTDAEKYVQAEFSLPAIAGVNTVDLLGEFSDWQPIAMTLHDEAFQTSTFVRGGRSYRFRFLVDHTHWVNAWDADEYVANEFGGFDSVIHVPYSPDRPIRHGEASR
jgi:hypothetical protein